MKIKYKKCLKYAVTMLLIVVMFISAMPYSLLEVFADEVKDFAQESERESVFIQTDKLESTDIDDTKQLDEAYIIDENIEKRTANSKEFAMSDGSVIVQYFSQNVHYLEGDTFNEIDNTLIETKNEDGESVYENKSNFYKVKISKDFQPNEEFIEVENGDHELNFTYIDSSAKSTFAEKYNTNKTKTINEYKGKKLKTPKDFYTGEGKISYKEISENIDLQYEVKENGIKENIIVKDYLSDYDFDFKIKTKNLNLQKNEDGSISAIDEKGNIKYLIPPPFMFDANGKYNFEVEYSLNKVDNDYILIISADENWIETEAKLPVTIDPIIETLNYTNFSYVNVYEKGTGTQSTAEVYVGEKEGGNKSNAYLKFELNSRGKNYTLVNASVTFHHKTEGMSLFASKNIKYSASVVDSEMPLSDITYTNKPARLQFFKTIGADLNVGSTEETHTCDIELYTVKNDAITIGFEREANNTSGGYVKIFTTGSNGIYLTLRYKQITGLDDSYSLENSKIGGVEAYVNKSTGYLTLNCDFASVNNLSELPLQTSLVYNAFYNEVFTELGVPIMFGNDFKLNFQQYVREEIGEYILLYDADGSITILNFDNQNGEYRTQDGKLTANVSGVKITVYDAQLNKRVFRNGRLEEIYRGEETTTGVFGDSIKISYVSTSGVDAEKISDIEFYKANCTTPSDKITFSYSGTRVSSVTTYHNTTAMTTYTLSYDSSGNLIKLRNSNAAVDIFNIGYHSIHDYVEFVFNKDNEGFYFSHLINDSRIWKINQMAGKSLINSRWFDYIEFNYDTYYSFTEAYYYMNGNNVSNSYVCFDALRNPISEWVEDESGKITGINRGYHEFEYSQNIYLCDYTRENIGFEEKLNTSFSTANLSTGQTATGSVSSSSGIVNNLYYKYGLTFLVESDSKIDLTVTFGGQSKRILLSSGGKLYVTLPCGYVQSGTFVFKNNGSIYSTKISNVSYNVIDYVKETKSFEAEPAMNNVYATTEIISYNKKGEYEQRIYDGYQRLVTVNQQSIEDNVLKTTTYTYNSNDLSMINQVGNITTKRNGSTIISKNFTYADEPDTVTTVTTANGAKKRTVQTTTTNNNKHVVTNIDENNIQTVQTYSVLNGDIRLESVSTGGIIEKYTYDYLGDVTSITLVDSSNDEILSTTNSYSNGIVSGHTFADNTFTKTYDSLGFVSSIKHNGNTMLSYEYVDDLFYSYDNYLESVAYANGQLETHSYSGNSTTIEYKKNNSDTNSENYTYNYDSSNRLTSSNYTQNGTELLNYDYGDLDSTTQSTLNITGDLTYDALFTINYNDVYNRITSTSDKFTRNNVNTTYNVTYQYNNKGQIIYNKVDEYSSSVTYDNFDRLNKHVAKYNGSSVTDKSYVYDTYTVDEENVSTTYTTNRLKSITDNLYGKTVQSSYDSNGFVESIEYNGKTYNYTYDEAGRLKTETIDGVTKEYTYDENNNISSVHTGDNITSYNHETNGRITSYIDNNNVANHFRYDAMGNPVMYKGASSTAVDNMVWTQGRKLESGTLNGNEFSYAYDMNGMRYKKNVNGKVTEYYLDGSKIIAECYKEGVMTFLNYYIYDMTGIAGMTYCGETYYFEKNTLGDVIGIRKRDGFLVATYTYDAWGNILTKSGSMADINPFRYRGYYYDEETGFYYLQSRYYDPSTRMFINADNYEIVSTLAQTVGQLNMYAYCNNNPVMFTDESGHGIFLSTILGAVLGFISGGLSYSNGEFKWDWDAAVNGFITGTITGFLGGAISGALGALGSTLGKTTRMFIQGVSNSLVSGLINIAQQVIINGDVSFTNLILSMEIGFMSGMVGIIIPMGFNYLLLNIGMSITEMSIFEFLEYKN